MAKKGTVKVEFTREELWDVCHCLLMTSVDYLQRGTVGGNLNHRNMSRLYDRLSALREIQ